MKNRLAIVASAGILFGGLTVASPLVKAADSEVNEVKEQNENSVITLTIEDAIERALKNDRNIIILGYQYELLKLERNLTEDSIDELEDKIDEAEGFPIAPTYFDVVLQGILDSRGISYDDYLADAVLKQEIDALTWQKVQENQAKNEGNQAIADKMNKELTPRIDDLKKGLKQNEVNDEKFRLQLEETKEGIRFMIKARFIELLSQNDGLALQKNYLDAFRADIYKAEQERDMGVVSRQSVSLLKRDLTKQENDFAKKQQNYELELKKFLLDLGLSSTQKVELTAPDFSNLKKVDKSKTKETLETFLAKSFALKKIEQDIEKLEYDRDKLLDKDDDDDYTHYYEDMNHQNIKIMLEEKKKHEQDIEKHIVSLYEKAEEAYDLINEKQWGIENHIEDEKNLAIQYELGLISKHEYEKATLANKQAIFDENMAKVAYYLKLEEIAIVEKGIFLSQ